jgi:DNA ligase-1
LGDKYEAARLKLKNPHGPPSKTTAKKPASKAKAKPSSPSKRKRAEDDDKPAKRARKPASTSRGKFQDDEDDEEDASEEDEEDAAATSSKNVPGLLLANKWDIDSGPDPIGWWISEKLDGVRFVAFRSVTFASFDVPCSLEPSMMGRA